MKSDCPNCERSLKGAKMPLTEVAYGRVFVCPHCGEHLQTRMNVPHVILVLIVLSGMMLFFYELRPRALSELITLFLVVVTVLGAGIYLLERTINRNWRQYKKAERW
jgi:hypothetical protein